MAKIKTIGIMTSGGDAPGKVGGQAVLGRQIPTTTPWLTERHGYDPTSPLTPYIIIHLKN